jgi:hypothetical protein
MESTGPVPLTYRPGKAGAWVTLYVENLPVGVGPADLAGLFAPYGRVAAARVWTDPDAGPSYRVGFVDLADGGLAATLALDGAEYRGRAILVGETDLRSETGFVQV